MKQKNRLDLSGGIQSSLHNGPLFVDGFLRWHYPDQVPGFKINPILSQPEDIPAPLFVVLISLSQWEAKVNGKSF